MIKYSIIIPHKNCPLLLDRCIASIPRRDDVEVIVVDDNSDDIVFDSLHFIQRPDVKIVFNKQGGGGGFARNIGVSIAKGEWIIFSDSDDTFCTQSFDNILNKYESDEADIIFFAINCLDSTTFSPLKNAQLQYMDYINDKKNPIDKCRYMIKVPWGKMIKKSLVSKYGILFDTTRVGNDAWFSLQVGYFAKNVKIDKTPIYNWLVRSGSVTSHRDLDSVITHFNLAVKLNKFKEENGLVKYRSSLFLSLPMLLNAGVPLLSSMKLVYVNTPNKFILHDIYAVIRFVIKKIRR